MKKMRSADSPSLASAMNSIESPRGGRSSIHRSFSPSAMRNS
jgi:hypothetical protein